MKKEKHVNPVNVKPVMRAYPEGSFILSIFTAEDDRFWPWLFSDYVYAIYNTTDHRYAFYAYNIFRVEEGLVTRHIIEVAKDLTYCEDATLNMILSMLRHGHYLTCWMNERYIPNRGSYQQQDFDHNNLIYGFNTTDQTFYILGYSGTGQYVSTTIRFQEFLDSMHYNSQPMVTLDFIKPNEEFEAAFDKNRLKTQIQNYLISAPPAALGYPEIIFTSSDWIQGIAATQALIGTVELYAKNGVDMRASCFLRDRTYFMYLRIQYLMDHHILEPNPEILEAFKRIYQYAERVHMLSMKFQLTGKMALLDLMKKYITDIVADEKKYLTIVLDELA